MIGLTKSFGIPPEKMSNVSFLNPPHAVHPVNREPCDPYGGLILVQECWLRYSFRPQIQIQSRSCRGW